MKSKGEVLKAITQFSKDIGAPESIICDEAVGKTSNNLHKFCRDIGKTLGVFDKGGIQKRYERV